MSGWKPGVWSAICDVCGFRYKSTELRKRWDSLMVCEKDFETRHPQDFLRTRSERVVPPWTRPEPPDNFSLFCDVWTSSSYADIGTADCMRADYAPPYAALENLAISAIVDIAIVNRSIVGVAV